jgi:hypothetical protein
MQQRHFISQAIKNIQNLVNKERCFWHKLNSKHEAKCLNLIDTLTVNANDMHFQLMHLKGKGQGG